MVSSQIASVEEIQGCSENEIKELEVDIGRSFPTVKYADPQGLCKEQTLPNMGERAAGDNIGSMLRGEGTGKIDDIAKKPFLPDEYYKNNYAPMQGTPGARIDLVV